MNRLLWLLLVAGILAMGLALYRSHYSGIPGIDPHAAKQIRNAQKR